MTAQYNLENADSEKEFKSLETKLAAVTASAKEQEVGQELEMKFSLGTMINVLSPDGVESSAWSGRGEQTAVVGPK